MDLLKMVFPTQNTGKSRMSASHSLAICILLINLGKFAFEIQVKSKL